MPMALILDHADPVQVISCRIFFTPNVGIQKYTDEAAPVIVLLLHNGFLLEFLSMSTKVYPINKFLTV
jgi:hypothetical protein